MKRLFLLLLGLGLATLIGWFGWNVWQTTGYFETQGREATLIIGKRYNAERWSSPVPLKKIYTYTAKLEPKYEVLVETDQELKDGEKRAIRFLTRDLAGDLLDYSARPVVNTIRIRGAEDGAPVKVEDTEIFDQLVDKWMGPPAKGGYVRARPAAEKAPTHGKPTVPFIFADAGDSTWRLMWVNSRAQEWLLLGIAILSVQGLLIAAYDRQKEARVAKGRGKKFVHPSLRRIEADSPATPSKKLTYVPRPDEEIVLSDSEKRRPPAAPTATSAPAPAASESAVPPPAPSVKLAPVAPSPAPSPGFTSAPAPAGKAPEDPISLTDRETAPPMPINRDDVVLKLRRKPGGGGGGGSEGQS